MGSNVIPAPPSNYPQPWTALIIPGFPEYQTRAAFRAANPQFPEPEPFDPKLPQIKYVPPAGHFLVWSGKDLVSVGPFNGPNLPNDDKTFTLWSNDPNTPAKQDSGSMVPAQIYLSTQADALKLLGQLITAGFQVKWLGDISAQLGFVMNGETRGAFAIEIGQARYMVAEILAGSWGKYGEGAPVVFNFTDAPQDPTVGEFTCTLTTYDYANLPELTQPCRALIPGKEQISAAGGLFQAGQYVLDSIPSSIGYPSEGGGLTPGQQAEMDQILSEEQKTKQELDEIAGALGQKIVE